MEPDFGGTFRARDSGGKEYTIKAFHADVEPSLGIGTYMACFDEGEVLKTFLQIDYGSFADRAGKREAFYTQLWAYLEENGFTLF